jgi:hypothetical protein
MISRIKPVEMFDAVPVEHRRVPDNQNDGHHARRVIRIVLVAAANQIPGVGRTRLGTGPLPPAGRESRTLIL